jgi:DNA-binding response OmpR family regulator
VSDARQTGKVLIVDVDPAKLQALRAALTTADYHVTSATSASFALTTLERDRPDLIVSGNRSEDMDGVELCSIIRSDPATHDIPFLLLSGPTRPTPWAVAQAGVDMLLAGDFVVSAVVDRISKLMRRASPQAEPEPGPPPPLPSRVVVPRVEAGARTFEGSFGALDLVEVTQAIAIGGKTGRLSLELEGGKGSLLFDSGRVVHAEFASRSGESAFAALVSAAESDLGGTFRFNPVAELPAGAGPRTIQKSVDQLLLSIASGIDESRAAAGAPLPPPRT